MKTKQKTIVLLMALIGIFAACEKEPNNGPFDPDLDRPLIPNIIDDSLRGTFNSLIATTSKLQYDAALEPPQKTGPDSVLNMGQYVVCTVTPMAYAPEHSARHIFEPAQDIIYPGAILDGFSIKDGTYRPIITQRDTMQLSMSIASAAGGGSNISIPDPKLSTTRDGVATMVQNAASNSTPAFYSYEYEYSRAYNELDISIGAEIKGWGNKVKGSYDFTNMNVKSRHLVRFVQKYYTIDMDLPVEPDDLFLGLPDWNDFNGKSPVYVSSVTYGRVVYIMIESDTTHEVMKKTLDAKLSILGVGGSINATNEENQMIHNSKVNMLIMGGSSTLASHLITGGFDSWGTFINDGAQFSATNDGVAIAYTLRHLSDNSISNMVTYKDYVIRDCNIVGELAMVNIDSNVDYVKEPNCESCNTIGDDEFGGQCNFSGTVKLVLKNNNTEVWAEIDATWDEPTRNGGPDDTFGHVNSQNHGSILLYQCPFDKRISTIDINTTTYWNDNHDQTGQIDSPTFTSDFINKIDYMGDTGGGDLPGDYSPPNYDNRAWMKISFKSFPISLVNR